MPALAEDLQINGDGLAVPCEESPWVVDAGTPVHVAATSAAGLAWEFEVPAEGECLTIELSLDTTTTSMLAVVTLDQPVTVSVGGETVEVATRVTWDEISALQDLFLDFGALRRALLDLKQEEKVALLLRPPGRYLMVTWYVGHRGEDWVRFYEGEGGVNLTAFGEVTQSNVPP